MAIESRPNGEPSIELNLGSEMQSVKDTPLDHLLEGARLLCPVKIGEQSLYLIERSKPTWRRQTHGQSRTDCRVERVSSSPPTTSNTSFPKGRYHGRTIQPSRSLCRRPRKGRYLSTDFHGAVLTRLVTSNLYFAWYSALVMSLLRVTEHRT